MIISPCAGAFGDIAVADPLAEKAEALKVLGILDGMEDGSFRPEDFVTREQFAKIVTCIFGKKDTASARTASPFTDVANGSWASGYISFAAENGIISGFPDGSFGGTRTITCAQTATILLRCLGYSDEDIGFHWPKDYMSKALSVGLCEGVSLSSEDFVTRRDAAIMIYNALFADMKDGNKLVTKSGMKLCEDAVLYGANKADASVVETSEGSFKKADLTFGIEDNYGKSGTLVSDRDGRAVLFKTDTASGREIVAAAAIINSADGSVSVSYSGGTVILPKNGTVYSDGEKTTASLAAKDITPGSRMVIYYSSDGSFSSAVLYGEELEGPRSVTAGYEQIYEFFDIEKEPTVIRKGVSASVKDIARLDVVYYEKNTNTVYAYADREGGIYEKAEPSKSNVTSVTVSGKKYSLSASAAAGKLNESPGAFDIGDYVTLLFDKNGDVCDVVSAETLSGRDLGVVMGSSLREDEDGNQKYAVKMFLRSGREAEYTADRDYSAYKGALAEMKFENGILRLNSIKYVSKSGAINKELMTFDNLWLSQDCSVLVLLSDEKEEAVVKKIRFGDIDGISLSKGQVIHVEQSGDMGDVTLLYLTDVTDGDYEYAVITKVETERVTDENGRVRTRSTGRCEVLCGGEIKYIDVGNRYLTSRAVGINKIDGSFKDAVLLGSGDKIAAVSGERIKVGGTIYRTAESYDIYKSGRNGNYTLISPEEAMKISGSVELYGDAASERGGKVRLVIVSD